MRERKVVSGYTGIVRFILNTPNKCAKYATDARSVHVIVYKFLPATSKYILFIVNSAANTVQTLRNKNNIRYSASSSLLDECAEYIINGNIS
jgi:hypothetical protein